MRAPVFWNRYPPDWRARLLTPLGALYAGATARRVARPADHRAGVPVICVGNLTAGGAGKTPTVIALAARLTEAGRAPVIVSRGHGGRETGPLEVDPARHGAADVGDEPLLMAAFAPVVIGRDRAAAARLAESLGAGVILMDDGFQNPSVEKDLSLVVADAAAGFGNGRAIPAGPLREAIGAGLERADALVPIGNRSQQDGFLALWGPFPPDLQLLPARLTPLRTGIPLRGLKALAFAGIGRPEKFFDTLRAEGVELSRTVPLGDHQPLTHALMTRLEADAKLTGAQLLSTEKDAVRLPPAFRQKVMTVPVRLEFDDEDALSRLLDRVTETRP